MSFKVCTIGCGGMATTGHGPSYARYAATHPDTELAACCDLDEEKAGRFRDRFGFARSYTDMERMLVVEKPDAVCLIAPVHLTCPLSCQLLEQGYPLLMEKPPGMTADEVDRMIAAAARSGAPNQVAFNRRYMPLVRALKARLAELSPGSVQYLRYDFSRISRSDADFSTTAIHGIDTARFLAGAEYAEIRFRYQQMPRFGPAVANLLLECTFANGVAGQLDFCPMGGVVTERATLHANDHTFFADLPIWGGLDMPGRVRHLHKGALLQDLSGDDLPDGTEGFVANGFYGENESFFDDIRHGRRPAGDLRSGRQSVEIMQCLRERRASYRIAE